MRWTSEWQTPAAATRTCTSPGPGGSSRTSSTSSRPRLRRTHACTRRGSPMVWAGVLRAAHARIFPRPLHARRKDEQEGGRSAVITALPRPSRSRTAGAAGVGAVECSGRGLRVNPAGGRSAVSPTPWRSLPAGVQDGAAGTPVRPPRLQGRRGVAPPNRCTDRPLPIHHPGEGSPEARTACARSVATLSRNCANSVPVRSHFVTAAIPIAS